MKGSNVRGGWAGKLLKINLSNGKIIEEPLTDDLAYGFLGSRGFDAKFLWDLVKPGIDPLSPDNPISLGAGLLCGTIFPENGRVNVGCLSPLTGIYGYGNTGGYWPGRLKAAGYDHVVITGKSPKPVYILINDDGVEIKDAGDIWGTTTLEMQKILREKHGKDVRVCGIGPAGENLVRTASTMVDGSFSAHGGSGAVWGSKYLKAIAVTGTKKIEIAKPEEFYQLARREHQRILDCTERPFSADYKRYGTLLIYEILATFIGYGADARHLTRDEAKNIFAQNIFEKFCHGYHAGCSNCLESCSYLSEVFVGPYAGARTIGMRFGSTDYMTLGMGNVDPASMVKFHSLVSQYGLCGKMMPTAIMFALELYERGIITKEDTGGIEIKSGDPETIMELTHMTALREGFGNILAEGPGNMARIIQGAHPYRHGVYGRLYTISLAFCTGTRGTDHLSSMLGIFLPPENRTKIWENLSKKIPGLSPPAEPGVKGKGGMMAWDENTKAVFDGLGRCMLPAGGVLGGTCILAEVEDDPFGEERAKLLSILTGRELSTDEILKCGERIFNLERAFNVRQGARKEFDFPPEPEQHLDFDYVAYSKVNPEIWKEYLEDYYKARGWDVNTGIPTRAKLDELGLGYVADELEANIPYPPYEGPPLWPLDRYPSGGKRPKW